MPEQEGRLDEAGNSPSEGTVGGLRGGAAGMAGLENSLAADLPERSIPVASPYPSATASPPSSQLSRPWRAYAAVAALALLLVAAAVWGIFDRRNIALRWPPVARVYDHLGLDSHQPGDGIDFRDVKSELVYDGGILRLTVEGSLVNTTQREQKLPHILADAMGADGGTLQSWRIDAPTATLGPLAAVSFRSTINAPREGVVNVTLNFIGRKNAAN